MAIRYKVVTNKRKSALSQHMPRGLAITYKKGAVVSSKEGTFGIMTFEHLHQAEHFRWKLGYNYMILKVRPLGRAKKTPRRLLRLWNYETLKLLKAAIKEFKKGDWQRCQVWVVPKGTKCYQSVKVLD